MLRLHPKSHGRSLSVLNKEWWIELVQKWTCAFLDRMFWEVSSSWKSSRADRQDWTFSQQHGVLKVKDSNSNKLQVKTQHVKSYLPQIRVTDTHSCWSSTGSIEVGLRAGSWGNGCESRNDPLWKEHLIWTSIQETCGGTGKNAGSWELLY